MSREVVLRGSGPVPTVAALVQEASETLRRLNPALEAEREARDIVSALAGDGGSASWVVLNSGARVESPIRARVLQACGRRAAGAPLAYAVGRSWFRHLALAVDERVLIPRPETEILVDLVLELVPGGVVVDVGTGSGAIALSLALEGDGRFHRVIGTDVSADALAVAHANAEPLRSRLRSPVDLLAGSLLAPLRGERVDAVVSNPPYIAGGEVLALPQDVRDWEPPVALCGGADGLMAIRPLVAQAATALRGGGLLALEVDARRAEAVATMVRGNPRFAQVDVRRDLTGRERFVLARRQEGGA